MLEGKNVVIISGKDKKSYQAIPYDRVYLEFSPTDEVEEITKNVNKEPIKVNGEVFKAIVPKNDFTSDLSTAAIETLLTQAVDRIEVQYGTLPRYQVGEGENKTPVNPKLILLEMASYGADLWTRAKIQGEYRPPAVQDEAVATEKLAKQMIAASASRGKVLSLEKAMEKAKAFIAAQNEEETEEAATV